MVDGFPSYAPELSREGGGFKPDFFGELAAFEDQNFWFRSRNRLILWALGRYCASFRSFLEIGCGTGYVLAGISKTFQDRKLYGSEIFTAGLACAAKRLTSVKLMQMDARAIPFTDEFDCIGAFDVIEHIKDDEEVLAQVNNALKPGGVILITVPQHRWLWSKVDEDACHVRRYSSTDLHKKLEIAGFRILRSTSFVALLLPAMMISRLLIMRRKVESTDGMDEFRISPWLNRLFGSLLDVECWLIRLGINLPFGGSRLIIGLKPAEAKGLQ